LRITSCMFFAALACAGCGSPFPDERALSAQIEAQDGNGMGLYGSARPLRIAQPSEWSYQYTWWDGDGRFDGVEAGGGASLRTNFAYGAAPPIAYSLAILPFLPWLRDVDGDTARWLMGAGIVAGALVDAAAGIKGSPGGLDMGIRAGRVRVYPEAGMEYGRYGVDGGDELVSLRWLGGFRVERAAGMERARAFVRCGVMVAEMRFDVRDDFSASGPYAGLGAEWVLSRRGVAEEPAEIGIHAAFTAASLGEGEDGCILLSGAAGLSFRW